MEIAEHITEDVVGRDKDGSIRLQKSSQAWRIPQVIEVPVAVSKSDPDQRATKTRQRTVRQGHHYYYRFVFEGDEHQIWTGFECQAAALYDRQRP